MNKIVFYAVAEHHAVAIRPIYEQMKRQGKNVEAVFNQPFQKASEYSSIVSSTAAEAGMAKAKDTIYHFHSLSPYHVNPSEQDYRYIPLFKAVMFPGEWWVTKWKNLPKHAVVGWPKSDILFQLPETPHERTVLYASSMNDFLRMQTLKEMIHLSETADFNLMVKPHGGTAMWFPRQHQAMKETCLSKRVEIIEHAVDITTLFPLVDVIVSESSGALWEFLATDKPAIQMTQATRYGRPLFQGILHSNITDLGKTIQKCFDNPSICKDIGWREKIMGKVDGKSTDRAIRFIEEVFGDE